MFDLAIIGGGPAGTSAGVYAARKQLNTIFITKEWGGQSMVSPDIHNWIGTRSISGDELAKNMQEHLKEYAGKFMTITDNVEVSDITKIDGGFSIKLNNGETKEAKTIMIGTGSKRRKLPVPGAEEFDQKGLTYCATCDGPLFAGRDVVVIGGGNAGFETASQLLAYAKSVTLLHRGPAYKADAITVEKVLAHENMTGILNAQTSEVLGDKFVTGIKYKDGEGGEEHELKVGGIFVEIGLVPNTEFISNSVELDEYKRIKIDPWTQQTNTEGIWAAGDCTNVRYHQNNISAGDAIKALEDIYIYIKNK